MKKYKNTVTRSFFTFGCRFGTLQVDLLQVLHFVAILVIVWIIDCPAQTDHWVWCLVQHSLSSRLEILEQAVFLHLDAVIQNTSRFLSITRLYGFLSFHVEIHIVTQSVLVVDLFLDISDVWSELGQGGILAVRFGRDEVFYSASLNLLSEEICLLLLPVDTVERFYFFVGIIEPVFLFLLWNLILKCWFVQSLLAMMRFQVSVVLFQPVLSLGFMISLHFIKHFPTYLASIQRSLLLACHPYDHIPIELDALVLYWILVEYFWWHFDSLINLGLL